MNARTVVVMTTTFCVALVGVGVASVRWYLRHPCTRYESRTVHVDYFPGVAIGLATGHLGLIALEREAHDETRWSCVERRP